MNFFYGINNGLFTSEIQIPIFQNRKPKSIDISLFKGFPKNGRWIIEEIKERKINKDFFLLKGNEISNNEIYFLANQKDFIDYDYLKLKNFNNFTDTTPAYRANFKILFKGGGFSSFQSDYPYSMVPKKGTILSSVNSIGNKDADKNFIFIRNIYEKPICEKLNAFLVNINTRKIEEKFEIKTNYTNSIELRNDLIKPEIFLITKDYIGVPMFVSISNKHISFEHTHPPHAYILSKNKFKKITELKKDINEIIN